MKQLFMCTKHTSTAVEKIQWYNLQLKCSFNCVPKGKLEQPNTIKTIHAYIFIIMLGHWIGLFKKCWVQISAVLLWFAAHRLWSPLRLITEKRNVLNEFNIWVYVNLAVSVKQFWSQGHIRTYGQKTFLQSHISEESWAKHRHFLHSDKAATEESPWLPTFWLPTSNTEERKGQSHSTMTIDITNIPVSQDRWEKGYRKRKKTWIQINWWVGASLGTTSEVPAALQEKRGNLFYPISNKKKYISVPWPLNFSLLF